MFVWRTSEACPLRKTQGAFIVVVVDLGHPNWFRCLAHVGLHSVSVSLCVCVCVCLPGDDCRVRDPRSGYVFDLSSLSGRDFMTPSAPYQYHLSVCGVWGVVGDRKSVV